MTENIYETLPLTGDNPAIASTVDGTLVITKERTLPDGSPILTRASCFGKPADAGKYRPKTSI